MKTWFPRCWSLFFFFNDTATSEIYTLSLHYALPILLRLDDRRSAGRVDRAVQERHPLAGDVRVRGQQPGQDTGDRKSTLLNSSHANISYAVFCLKKTNQ